MADLYDIRRAALEHFSPKGAHITAIETHYIPGVPVLGSLFPQTFGRAAFDTFSITLPPSKRTEGQPTEAFEVSSRRGRNRIEVVHDYTKTGMFGRPSDRRDIDHVNSKPEVLKLLGILAP